MPKFQSLADSLGVSEEKNGNSQLPQNADGNSQPAEDDFTSLEKMASLTGPDFANAVLNSREFRLYILHTLTLGTIPPAVLTRLMDYAPKWGKPVERVEVKDTSSALEDLTPEQLEARALRLVEMARSVRLPPMPKGTPAKDSIH